MEPFGRQKKQMDEISFVLQNIFIVHPTPGSKYKIRVIINRNNQEQAFKKVNNRYTFQLPSDKEIPKNACFMVLLEKTFKNGIEGQYLQIGKGELELTEALDSKASNRNSIINGVIYGTRSFNYDRIVGKYTYQIYHKEGQSPRKVVKSNNNHKVSFVDHQKKEKPSQFAFKKSITQHNNQITSKIKQLAKSMDEIIGKSRIQQELQPIYGIDPLLPSINQVPFEENQYLYKYSPKIEQTLKDSSLFQELRVLTIKNIRIESEKQAAETVDSLFKSTVEKKPEAKHKKPVQFMIIFYELLEDRKMRKRLLEIYLPLIWGKDNRSLVNSLFYLPKTDKKILVQVIPFTSAYNKDRSLNGVIEPSHAKSRLIELLDSSNQERGIIICVLERCTQIDKDQVKGYHRQTEKFQRSMRRNNCQFTSFIKKINPISETKQSQEEAVILDNSVKDTLYSQFHPKKKANTSKKNRYKTQIGGPIEINPFSPSISRSRNNFSVLSENASRRRQTKGSLNLESKSIRGYPSDSETVVGLKKQKFKDKSLQNLQDHYRLYLQSAQINLYGIEAANKKIWLNFDMFQQSERKKIVFTSEKQWYPLRINFKGKKINDTLTISVLLNRKNTTKYLKIGKCHLQMSQFKDSPSQKLKVFVTYQNKITSYLVLDFRLFREKNPDQITQSFYYKEQYDRQRSLISESEKKYDLEAFDRFDEIDIPEKVPVFDIDEEQFEISVDSSKISRANNTQVHYISEKISEKAPSEVLEEEDYQHGMAMKKKY